MAKKPIEKSSDKTFCAALSYLVVGLIWYAVDDSMKKDKYVTFHVKQGLVLLIASLVVNIIGTIIPFIGWFIILPIGSLLLFIAGLIGFIRAIQGKESGMPVLEPLGEKFRF